MLKYLFTAHFTDGTSFEQNAQDVSLLDPVRSSFYDLLQELDKGKELHSFTLVGDGHTYAVDLLDGHFEIDSLPIWPTPKGIPAVPDHYKLIYHRQHTHDFQNGRETGHAIRFIFGWECHIGTKNYHQTIGVD